MNLEFERLVYIRALDYGMAVPEVICISARLKSCPDTRQFMGEFKSNDQDMAKLRCSFCDKSASAVERLIKAPEGREVYICSECIRACAAILEDTGVAIQQPPKETVSHWLLRKLTRRSKLQQMR